MRHRITRITRSTKHVCKIQKFSMKFRRIGRWLRLIPTIVLTVASSPRCFSTWMKTNNAFSRHTIISNYRELTTVHTFYVVAPVPFANARLFARTVFLERAEIYHPWVINDGNYIQVYIWKVCLLLRWN